MNALRSKFFSRSAASFQTDKFGIAERYTSPNAVFLSSREAWSRSANPLLRVIGRVVRALGHIRRFLLNPRVRSENITRMLHGEIQLQGATFSQIDRYPELFAACAMELKDVPTPKILSFGCATGEEAFALAEYLPDAAIFGVDINRWCLARARRVNRNPRIRFLHGLSAEFVALSGLDAIFAMAVFQRSENRTHTAGVAYRALPFAKFEQQITSLDARLKSGGLLFIDHADFRFEDTKAAAHYTALEFEGNSVGHDRPLFGPNNQLIATSYTRPRAFRKLVD